MKFSEHIQFLNDGVTGVIFDPVPVISLGPRGYPPPVKDTNLVGPRPFYQKVRKLGAQLHTRNTGNVSRKRASK